MPSRTSSMIVCVASFLTGLAGLGLIGAGCGGDSAVDSLGVGSPDGSKVDAGKKKDAASTNSGEATEDDGDDDAPPTEEEPGADSGSTVEDAGRDSGSSPVDAGNDAGREEDEDAGTTPPPVAGVNPGDFLITEIMYATYLPEPASEWIEIFNNSSKSLPLSGLTLEDGIGRTHKIGSGVSLAPRSYGVLVRDRATAIGAKVPASAIVYEYGAGLGDTAGIVLANGATGGILLRNGQMPIAKVFYGSWFSLFGGASIQLSVLNASALGEKSAWCISPTKWATGAEKGTPGAAHNCL